MNGPILSVNNLSVSINGLHILQGVTFDVAASGVTALLGRNGVGKTTTLRAMMGMNDGTGSIVFGGYDISGMRTHRRVQCGLGYVPEDRCVFAGLTVAENLKLAERRRAVARGAGKGVAVADVAGGGAAGRGVAAGGVADGGAARRGVAEGRDADGGVAEGRDADGGVAEGGVADGGVARKGGVDGGGVEGGEGRGGGVQGYELVYSIFPELAKRAKQRAGSLSGGQQQMLSLARVLLNDNRLLLVDEPTKGLAPKVVTEVAEVLQRVAQAVPVLLVEQNLAVVRRLAKDAIVLEAGRVAWTGEADVLLGDAELTKSLLGVGR